jgi:hypothetical protein
MKLQTIILLLFVWGAQALRIALQIIYIFY